MKRLLLIISLSLLGSFGFSQNMLNTLQGNPTFSIFMTAIEDAGLSSQLIRPNRTLFLPTNDAFSRLSPEALNAITEDADLLTDILKLHIVRGTYYASDFVTRPLVRSVGGDFITMSTGSGFFYAENASITNIDYKADNGIIHVIDSIILPDFAGTDKSNQLTYLIDPSNQEGIFGTVTIEGNEYQSIVSVRLTGAPKGSRLPVKMLYGNCGTEADTFVGLNDLMGSFGTSNTVVNLPISSFQSTNAFVKVALSSDRFDYDLACGEVGQGAY